MCKKFEEIYVQIFLQIKLIRSVLYCWNVNPRVDFGFVTVFKVIISNIIFVSQKKKRMQRMNMKSIYVVRHLNDPTHFMDSSKHTEKC